MSGFQLCRPQLHSAGAAQTRSRSHVDLHPGVNKKAPALRPVWTQHAYNCANAAVMGSFTVCRLNGGFQAREQTSDVIFPICLMTPDGSRPDSLLERLGRFWMKADKNCSWNGDSQTQIFTGVNCSPSTVRKTFFFVVVFQGVWRHGSAAPQRDLQIQGDPPGADGSLTCWHRQHEKKSHIISFILFHVTLQFLNTF